jgi:hypothetical protein
MISRIADADLRARIARLLADGSGGEAPLHASTSERFNAICQQLRELPAQDVAGKLALAGFTHRPLLVHEGDDTIEPSCATCMYFERHREFCALPELMLPVASSWSCILWRI